MGFPNDFTQGVPPAYQGNLTWVPDASYEGGGYWAAYSRGQHYSVAQLERIALDAGATSQEAGNLATIAEYSESGGDAGDWNSSGATGLWQEEWPSNYGSASDPGTREKLFTPHVNALVAVPQAAAGYGAWGSDPHWDPGIPPAAPGSVPGEFSNPAGGRVPAGRGSGGGGGGGVSTTSSLPGIDAVVSSAGGILHGTALMLDRFLAMGAPGQGWRMIFGAGTVAAGFGAYKAFTSGGDGEGHLPLAIALTGAALIGAFMTLRPWPQTSQGAIKPGAYAVDILEGRAPPAGPQAVSPGEVDLTETALGMLLGLWVAGKLARAASAGGSILGDILGFLGLRSGGGGGGGGEVPPVEAL